MGPRTRDPSERLVFLVAVVLTLGDAALTYVAIGVGGIAEGNPILLPLIDRYGAGVAMTIRAVVGIGLLVALWRLAERSTFARAAMVGVALVLGALAAYHLVGFRRVFL